MNAMVFGCGPAGLIAAHAITTITGVKPLIVSRPRKSELFGAQYLHAPIRGINDNVAPVRIGYTLMGDADEYRRKVYGDAWQDRVSPEDLLGEHDAWNIREAYDNLWRRYGDSVWHVDLNVKGEADANVLRALMKNQSLVVSSAPKQSLCYNPQHVFASQRVWAIGDAPERGQKCPVRVDVNMVVCNGDKWPSWYRAANVFGYATAEWPDDVKPPLPDIAEVRKPLFNTCDCWPDIVHVGRYGAWQKGVLSHEAWDTTVAALEAI